MKQSEVHCVVPADPDTQAIIDRSRNRVIGGEALPGEVPGGSDILDSRRFTLISSRPAKTRADTFLAGAADFAPITGTKNVLVLLVDFSDFPGTRPQNEFSDLLFSSGTYATGSMRDFYREASYNKLNVTGTVNGTGGGWYRAPQPKSFYADNNYGIHGAYPKNAQKLVEDVIDLAIADPNVNFANYSNGTGAVEALVVIAAGIGAEQTLNTGDIWSHKWTISSPRTIDGVQVSKYFIAPENGRVGVMAHELGSSVNGMAGPLRH